MYIYTSVWRENTIMIHVHINWCWCYSFLVFSSKFLLIFYHVSAFFHCTLVFAQVPYYSWFERKKNSKIKHFIGIWWFTQVGTFDADQFISDKFRWWWCFCQRLLAPCQSPLWLAEDTRIPAETQGWHLDSPSILWEENHDDCFGSVTSHLLMENFKLELFSNKLAVS